MTRVVPCLLLACTFGLATAPAARGSVSPPTATAF
jgi:hypothetical protein